MTEHKEKHVITPNGKENMYMYLAIVLLVALIAVTAYFAYSNDSTNTKKLSQAEVNQYVQTKLNKILAGRATVSVDSVTEDRGMYLINMTLDGDQGKDHLSSYLSKDGELLFMQPLNLKDVADSPSATRPTQTQPSQQTPTNIPKSDKPKIELFVMSYCPFGLQAEKSYIPVMSMLKDKADMSIKFVSYAMHGEKEVYENLRQYCIQEQDQSEYLKYMTCFVEKDDYGACLKEISIDNDKLKTCINETDEKYDITANLNDQSTWLGRYPPFNIHKDLNDLYGVRGSPTLVINGKIAQVTRSPEAFKLAICNAFNTKPSECDTVLSTSSTAPGFSALDAVSTSTVQANCG